MAYLPIAMAVLLQTTAIYSKTTNKEGCRKIPYVLAGNINHHKDGSPKNDPKYEVCYSTEWVTYYCPGDTICCTPGSPTSKCCPESHPLCIDEEYCCPVGYPKICGKHCCEEDSFCCDEENCCKDEKSCCKDQCCTGDSFCCSKGEDKTCCNEDVETCCGGDIGCTVPCSSQFDAVGCQLIEEKNDNLEELVTNLNLLDSSNSKYFYRVLSEAQALQKLLLPKNVLATKTVSSHVGCGSRNGYESQYISFTKDPVVLTKYIGVAKAKGIDVVCARVNTGNFPIDAEIIDLTDDATRIEYLGHNPWANNFAKSDKEVLVVTKIGIPWETYQPKKSKSLNIDL